MTRDEVESIFHALKEQYLGVVQPSEYPRGYILGGQPSSGKSSLNGLYHNPEKVLVVNGDLYRDHHPEAQILSQETLTYSEKTQIFSNVFTEGLIQEAIERGISLSIEGTMRRSEVVINTVETLKRENYDVELLCIAAPEEYTSINLFYRYSNELRINGEGRLADLASHDQACIGLLQTLDDAFEANIVDRIRIFEMFGKSLVANYEKTANGWSIKSLPSKLVSRSRENQLLDIPVALQFIERGIEALTYIQDKNIKEELTSRVNRLLQRISQLSFQRYNESTLDYNSLSDEIDRLTYGVEYFKERGLDRLWLECKEYNESARFIEERKQTGAISISQTFKMALDDRSIFRNGTKLEVVKIDGLFHLKVNGQLIDNSIKGDISKGFKR